VLAPLVFTVVLGIIVFIPLAVAINEAAVASDAIAHTLAQFRETGVPVPSWLPDLPFGRQLSAWWSTNLSDPKSAQRFIGSHSDAQAQFSWARSLGGEFVHRTSMLVLSLIATFVLLGRGAEISNRVLDAADRLFGDPGERLAGKLVETIRATVTGTTAVAFAEGTVLGAAYLVAGVPRPFLFALMTAALAMIPLGAWVVFSFASVLLMMQGGDFTVAFGLFAFGAVVMIIGDTLIWPWLVGEQAHLPFLIALIGIFGGLQTFGLIGLFVGPVLLAACWIVLQEWFLTPGEHRSG
jgi:predicted PurR-regulated permease PerM